ncbi:MAG: hypothetical protein HOP11_13585 [Saprospiraceae bacterium]|nr:hypothetical protein [Saprospiraceae bacterium]
MNSKAIIVLIISMCALLIQCRKENADSKQESCVTEEQITSDFDKFYIYYPGPQKNGYAKAIKINKEWKASAIIWNGILTIKFETFTTEEEENRGFESEIVYINVLTPKIGCTELGNRKAEVISEIFFTAVKGDTNQNIYIADTLKSNKLYIDTLDFVNNRISGKFMFSAKKASYSLGGPWYNLDELRFFNGEFHSNIID